MSISAAVTPSAFISRQALLVRLVGRAEARQRVGQHVLARQAELVHRAAGDDQRLGRIEAARDADDRLLGAARLQALRQALDLDVVGLVAIVAQLGGIRRHVGEALDGALERHAARAARRARSRPCGSARPCRPPASRSRRSRCCAAAPGGCGRDRRRRVTMVESFSKRADLGELVAALVDRGMAVPGQIGRRFAGTGRRVGVGRDARAPTGCRTAGGAPRPCRW